MATKYSLSIKAGTQILQFRALVHLRFSPEDFHLDPEEFYRTYGHAIPETPHFEVEITYPPEPFLKTYQLLVWRSRLASATFYINWPSGIPDRPTALCLFRIWAISSAVMMTRNVDRETINTILSDCEYNADKYALFMERSYEVLCGVEKQPTR